MFRLNILTRFLMRRFFNSFGLVMLVVCGIIFAVTFVERLPSNPTALATLSDSWTRLLEYVPLFLPLAVFMGTLLATYNLTKSSEQVIVSCSGRSPYQSARPFLVGAFLIGVFATTVINPYSVSLSTQELSTQHLKLVDGKIWLRETSDSGYITVTADSLHRIGNNLEFKNTIIYTQNTDFKLTARITTDAMILSDTGMTAEHATILDSDGKTYDTGWQTTSRLTPQTVLDRYLKPDQISFWQLPTFINKMTQIGIPVRGHLVQFWTLLFLPLTMISMATLGIAFSQTRQRRNFNFGLKFGLGIITCFGVYFLINMFNALGATGALPPLLSIIAPPLIIIACSGAFIASFDTI